MSSLLLQRQFRFHPYTLLIASTLIMLGGCFFDSNNDNDQPPPPPPPPPPPNTLDVDVDLVSGEVVGGGASAGEAAAAFIVNLDDMTISGTVTLTGLSAESVSIKQGFASETGTVLIELEESTLTQWVIADGVSISQQDLDDLEAGALYVEVTTAALPGGALRGQLLLGDIRVYFVVMTGAQEVPPVSSTGSAMGALTLDPSSGGVVVHINATDLDDAVAAHIHAALAGVNGDVIVGLTQDPENPAHWLSQDALLNPDQIDALMIGRLYLNLHTPANPGGEVRGQIVPADVEVEFTSLSGGDVVPAVNSPASGVSATTILSNTRVISVNVNLIGLDDATAVTVNRAPLGQNGPVAFELSQDANDPDHWSLQDQQLDEGTFAALRAQGLYILATAPGNPDGELRGQLEPAASTPPPDSAFLVISVNPADGAMMNNLPAVIELNFNRNPLASSVVVERFELMASGGDGSFADGNELAVNIVAVTSNNTMVELDLTGAGDSVDTYQLTIDGTSGTPFSDEAGLVLDGDGDGAAGGDFRSTFNVVEAPMEAPTFTEIQTEIFNVSCAVSGCHAGAAPAEGMRLEAGVSYGNIVNVASNQMPSLDRIEPGNPNDSYMVRKVEGSGLNGRMPLGQPALSNELINKLRDWVTAGAPDN